MWSHERLVSWGRDLSTVTIALEAGFHEDRVVVRVDGRVVHDAHGVSTRMQVGLAETVSAQVEGACTVEVELPDRDVRGSVGVEAPVNVRVSVLGSVLRLEATADPLFYA